jgi:type I restriction-modification system DNA methylase subunit
LKSTWFSDRKQYEFAKCIQDAESYGCNYYDVFLNFLTLGFNSMVQASLQARGISIDDKLEQEVLRIQEHAKDWHKYAEALAMMADIMEDEYDFLGQVSGSLGLNDKSFKGQCFTPQPLCEVMAQFTLGEIYPDDKHRYLISEPAVGGGAISMAVVKYLKNFGFSPQDYYIVAQDIDLKCVQMAYIQLNLVGAPVLVSWGNTLTMENSGMYETIASCLTAHPQYVKSLEKGISKPMEKQQPELAIA